MLTEAIFKALADITRLRIVRLLGAMELAVGELAQVLGQSQPRVSRHVGILCDAGLAERRREGSWVFLRAASAPAGAPSLIAATRQFLAQAEAQDGEFARLCTEDRHKLSAIREAREAAAGAYFAAHAEQWDQLRRLHSPDPMVEEALVKALGSRPLGQLLDIGTGTGRMAELFAPHADHITALDKNLEMLRIARAKLQHLPAQQVDLVQGDFGDLPFEAARFDTLVMHQVLHYAQDPESALREAARVTRPHGRIAIIDFAKHNEETLRADHAHARLGFGDEWMAQALSQAGYSPQLPIALEGAQLVVKIWLGARLAPAILATSKAKRA